MPETLSPQLKVPFRSYGGKSCLAAQVSATLGDLGNHIDLFFVPGIEGLPSIVVTKPDCTHQATPEAMLCPKN